MMGGLTNLSSALRRAVAVLAEAGVASPRVDAELLAAHVLGVPRGRLVLAAGLGPGQRARFEELVARRATRVPLQHLTGTAAFGRRELAVGPGVFVPRPETELLAQWAAQQPAGIAIDMCSGTGALALAIADRGADRVYAVESAPSALVWLRRNTAGGPVRVVAGDAADPAVLADLDGTADLVVCNPPYVPEAEPVPPEVAGHDPAEAVFAGPDGLAVIRRVVPRAAALLRPGGRFGIEHAPSHAAAVTGLLRGWFTEISDHPDLTGRPRYATGVRVAD